MKPFMIAVWMFLWSDAFCVGSIWRRKFDEAHTIKNPDIDELEKMDFDLNLSRPPQAPDSAIITKALKAIEDLNRKQFCHRFAASMLLDNCRTPQEPHVPAVTRNVAEDERREDYLKIFAVSLTVCDIEALQRPIPPQCTPYGQSTLMDIKTRSGSQSIQIDHSEMNSCLKAIGSDQSAVVSWKFNQQSAAVVCQVARMDIEKDETIALFASLTRLMAEVVEEVQKLSRINRDIRQEAEEAKVSVQTIRTSVDKLKAGLSCVWDGVSAEALKATDNVKDIFSRMSTYAADVEQLLNKLRQGALENHAEQAAMQLRAFDITVGIVTEAQTANKDMEALRSMLVAIYNNMASMGNGLTVIQDRQNKVDQQSAKVLSAMMNMTEQLHMASQIGDEHTVMLGKAAQAASTLADIVDKTTATASTWQNGMFRSSGPFGINWPLFIGTPVMVVLLGSYGLEPSLSRNASLVLSGLFLAKLLAMDFDDLRSWFWRSDWTQASESPTSAFPYPETLITEAVLSESI